MRSRFFVLPAILTEKVAFEEGLGAAFRLSGMYSMPSDEPSGAIGEVYKPSLSVDVTAEPLDESGNSSGTTPKTSLTPHVSTNIFVAGIPPTWDENDLCRKFQEFGEIISTKIVRRRHFAFVMFRKPESAHAAINAAHLTQATPTSPVLLHVSIAMHDEGVDDVPNDRIFIRGLPQWATKEHLKQCFSPFGTITESAVLMNPLGQCKGSGFVQFSSIDEAKAAIEARNSIRIENWDIELEVKYSETAEVRQQRQERNKNRQRHSPKYRQHASRFSLYTPPVPVVPQIPAYPVLGVPTSFPLFYPQAALTRAAPSPHMLYSPMVTSSALPMYTSPTPVFEPAPSQFPNSGDLHFSGITLTESTLLSLLQRYGTVEAQDILEDSGAAVRMADRGLHALIAQQLNGVVFSNGQVMMVGIYA